MSKQETLNCQYDLFLDLLTCLSIYEGSAKPKNTGNMRMEDFLNLS